MSPTERVARIRALMRRGLAYSKGSLAIFLVGTLAAVGVARNTRPVYRAECTVFAKARIRTDDRDDGAPSPDQIVRQGARLKDMLTTRGRLEMAIKTFHMYPETVANRSMLDAVEEMKPHVGFRSLEGALYVISFDGNQPDLVQKVTQYLSDTLIDDYAAGDLDDLRRDTNFLEKEEGSSLEGLEESTRALTVFLAAHPEFAVEAKQAAAPFGQSATSGIPLMPAAGPGAPAVDAELAALYREHGRLDGEAQGASGSRAGTPLLAGKQLDESIAQAQAAVEAAAKRVAESQADLASKSNLTEDHPDMRAARMAADAAARQLHEAKSSYANLRQLKEGGGAPVDPALVPPDVASKLKQVNAQIATRRAQIAKSHGPSASAARSANPEVTAVVELETEWQRLLRALGEARSHHDDLKLRAQHAKLALEAAHVQANEQMAVVDPAVRPTHPSKGGRTNTALAGLAAAFLLSLGYASTRVAVDDRLIDAEDIEALGLLPVLCVVPRLAPAKPRPECRHEEGRA
jgi:uncharacterized protein involved in exopolysaccharide biosynthesis